MIAPSRPREPFRAGLLQEYGARLESTNWDHDWGSVERLIFECCEDVDRMALSPVGAIIYRMKEAAWLPVRLSALVRHS
jgi:hypothetical protein